VYFEPIAKGIKFNQYVGVIQVNGLTIEINPKADKDDTEDKWKGVLLKMLQACGKSKASRTLESGLYAPGDVKDMAKITVNGKEHLLLSKNSNYLQLIKINN
jgi:hypothetical protein